MIDLSVWVSHIPKQLGHPSAVGAVRHDLRTPELEVGFTVVGAIAY